MLCLIEELPDPIRAEMQSVANGMPDAIKILIEDHGKGIPAEIAGELGRTYISRKQGGLGLRVLLSQASIERLGGEVVLTGMPGQGTRLEIWFPLQVTTEND